jgi:hypothetical protein
MRLMFNTYRSKWREKFHRDRDFFAQPTDHFANWNQQSAPDNEAWIQFLNSQTVLFGDGRRSAEKFLTAAIEVANRACAENRFRTELAQSAFPLNRGRALRVRAYANGLKDGTFDVSDLLTASQDFETWSNQFTGADWDSQTQAYFLAAVRMAIITGDQRRARKLLETKGSFKWHAEEHKLLIGILDECNYGLPIRNQQLFARVRSFFDRIRDPNFKPDIFMELDEARLEWGALINRFFETGEAINWDRVVELVSE